jgi:hypothetical protein
MSTVKPVLNPNDDVEYEVNAKAENGEGEALKLQVFAPQHPNEARKQIQRAMKSQGLELVDFQVKYADAQAHLERKFPNAHIGSEQSKDTDDTDDADGTITK